MAASGDLFHVGQHGGVEGFGFGQAMKGERKALADAVITDGQYVRTSQAEDQQHFDGPAADAANSAEAGDDFFIWHAADAGQGGYGAVEGLGGEVAESENFALRDAGGAELYLGGVEQVFGGGVEVAKRFE